jgi:16S rRNA (cytosine967-C5)-methyltransferase
VPLWQNNTFEISPFSFLYCRVSRYHSYINSAKEILLSYKGEEPFASFVKKYFSNHKKFGSRDRKQVIHLCYSYFRLGKAAMQLAAEERMLTALFLCTFGPNDLLGDLKPEWNERTELSMEEKILYLGLDDFSANLFPCPDLLSNGIEKNKFIFSHLQQPDIFLRIRPGKEKAVTKKLQQAGISFKPVSENCLAIPSSSKVGDAIELNREAVIQDYSSQKVGAFLKMHAPGIINRTLKAWDCCAGSGGKSIMLYDLNPEAALIVSDTRKSILSNLEKRFKEAGIANYKSFCADISLPNFKFPGSAVELIICDVPCSGSGTWGRTPEQLLFFDENKIDEYISLQRKISTNTIPFLQKGGYFLYITCSVYKKENEDVVEYIQQQSGLNLVKKEVLDGYTSKADTMFAALFQKPL